MTFNAVFAAGWDQGSAGTWFAYAVSGDTQTVVNGGVGVPFVWDAVGSSPPNDFFAVSDSDHTKIECRKSGLLIAALQADPGVTTDDDWMRIQFSSPTDPTRFDTYDHRMNADTYSPKILIPVPAGGYLTGAFFNRSGSSRTLTYWEADLRMILLA